MVMDGYTEDRRAIFTVNSGDPEDTDAAHAFHISSLRGSEAISQLFRFDLVLLTQDADVETSHLLAQHVTIGLERNLSSTETADPDVAPYRYINGIVSQASQVWKEGEGAGADTWRTFRVTVVPDTWNLTKSFQSRVFYAKTAWDIAAEIVPDTSETIDFSDVTQSRDQGPRGSTTEYEREHCIQYRETDMDFVARLLEEEGISYFYRQKEASHQLVLCDGSTGFDDCEQEGAISRLVEKRETQTHQYRVHDYKFADPSFSFEHSHIHSHSDDNSHSNSHNNGDGCDGGSIRDFPGAFGPRDSLDLTHVEEVAGWRSEEQNAKSRLISGTSESVTFSAGAKFKLDASASEFDDKTLLIVSVRHRLKQPSPRGGGDTSGNQSSANSYVNTFTCVLHDADADEVVYRPPRRTPKPRVEGPQTAVVEGPSDSPNGVHTDEWGRVKVKFHWDDRSDDDANVGERSAWVRVSEGWAGENYGTVFLPHVGDEVIVDFLEGNPDRPIVTGRVYNGIKKPARGELGEGGTGKLDPHKSIIQDISGNEIVFDSMPRAESITLNSPKGESFLTIGKPRVPGASSSGEWKGEKGDTGAAGKDAPVPPATGSVAAFTKGDSAAFQMGNKAEATVGNTAEGIVGNKYEFLGGFAYEGVVGGAVKAQLGVDFDLVVGNSYQVRLGREVEYHVGSRRVDSDKHYIVTSKNSVNLVGGQGGTATAKGKDDTAILELSDEVARMSVGENDKEVMKFKEKLAYSIRWGLAVGLVSSGVLKPLYDVGAMELSLASLKEAPEAAGYIGGGAGAASSVLNVGLLALALFLACIDTEDKGKPFSHANSDDDEPNAMVNLNQKGSVAISGIDSVDLRAVERVPHEALEKSTKAAEKKKAENGPGLLLKKKGGHQVKLQLNMAEGETSNLWFEEKKTRLQGGDELMLEADKKVTVEGYTEVELKGGGGKVSLTASGVNLNGNLVVAK